MLRVTVVAVGSLGERHWRDACAEYEKRLRVFCKPEIVEVDEYRLPRDPSLAEIRRGVEAEGTAILAKLRGGAHTVALCVEGRPIPSEELGAQLTRLAGETSRVAFVIGGSHGLSDAVKAAADSKLSMSAMTFPHQLARVMLLEQIYRAFSIAAGGKYHK